MKITIKNILRIILVLSCVTTTQTWTSTIVGKTYGERRQDSIQERRDRRVIQNIKNAGIKTGIAGSLFLLKQISPETYARTETYALLPLLLIAVVENHAYTPVAKSFKKNPTKTTLCLSGLGMFLAHQITK